MRLKLYIVKEVGKTVALALAIVVGWLLLKLGFLVLAGWLIILIVRSVFR